MEILLWIVFIVVIGKALPFDISTKRAEARTTIDDNK